MHQHLCSVPRTSPHCRYDPRYAGVVLSSLARLQHRDTQLVDAVLEKAVRRMDEAYTRDLAAVCKVGGVWADQSGEWTRPTRVTLHEEGLRRDTTGADEALGMSQV